MKKNISLIFIIICFSCNEKLPYGLKVQEIDTVYSIFDKNGYPILQESSDYDNERVYIIEDSTQVIPAVKRLLKYSNNKLGLIVMIKDNNNIIKYIKITPRSVQRYAELEVDYKIYSEEEYKKMNLKDDWVKIRY
jgi:hypothetical protein